MAGPEIFYASGGTLGTRVLLSQPSPPRDVAIADVNSDGLGDVVTLGDDGAIRVFRNSASGFTSSVVSGSNEWRLAVGDLTGDGRPDIVGCDYGFEGIDLFRPT